MMNEPEPTAESEAKLKKLDDAYLVNRDCRRNSYFERFIEFHATYESQTPHTPDSTDSPNP